MSVTEALEPYRARDRAHAEELIRDLVPHEDVYVLSVRGGCHETIGTYHDYVFPGHLVEEEYAPEEITQRKPGLNGYRISLADGLRGKRVVIVADRRQVKRFPREVPE